MTCSPLSYVLLRGRETAWSADYRKIYDFWKSSWNRVFADIDLNKKIFSDEFRRHDGIATILYSGDPIGLICIEEFSFEDPTSIDHSCFRIFKKQNFELLKSIGIQKVISVGNLTIHPNWRKKYFQPSLSSVLAGLCVEYLKAGTADALVCYTRNDRKVNSIFEEFGAISIEKGLIVNGIDSDIICIRRQCAKPNPNKVTQDFINYLWQQYLLMGAQKSVHAADLRMVPKVEHSNKPKQKEL